MLANFKWKKEKKERKQKDKGKLKSMRRKGVLEKYHIIYANMMQESHKEVKR